MLQGGKGYSEIEGLGIGAWGVFVYSVCAVCAHILLYLLLPAKHIVHYVAGVICAHVSDNV